MRVGRKKMGRPPLPPAQRASKRVNVRLTPAEYVRLKSQAGTAGLPMATYLIRVWKGQGS